MTNSTLGLQSSVNMLSKMAYDNVGIACMSDPMSCLPDMPTDGCSALSSFAFSASLATPALSYFSGAGSMLSLVTSRVARYIEAKSCFPDIPNQTSTNSNGTDLLSLSYNGGLVAYSKSAATQTVAGVSKEAVNPLLAGGATIEDYRNLVEFSSNSKTYFGQVADLQGASERAVGLLKTIEEQSGKLAGTGLDSLLRPFINRLDKIQEEEGLRAAFKTLTETLEAQTPANIKQIVGCITKLETAAIKDPLAVPADTVERIRTVLGDALTAPQKAAPVVQTSMLSSISKVFRGALTLFSIGTTLQEQRNINENYQYQRQLEEFLYPQQYKTTEVGLPSIPKGEKKEEL